MTTADALKLNLWKLLPHVVYKFKFFMLRQLNIFLMSFIKTFINLCTVLKYVLREYFGKLYIKVM